MEAQKVLRLYLNLYILICVQKMNDGLTGLGYY